MVWDGRCGRTFLRPEGRAPVALTAWLRLSRNHSVAPILVDHRDTMNTEKTKDSSADIGSLIGDFPEQMPPLVFLCVHRVSVVLAAVSLG